MITPLRSSRGGASQVKTADVAVRLMTLNITGLLLGTIDRTYHLSLCTNVKVDVIHYEYYLIAPTVHQVMCPPYYLQHPNQSSDP